MKEMDKDGLILCELQGKAFELSVDLCDEGSQIFVRRFMNSKTANEFDTLAILQTNLRERDVLERIDEEYGKSDYGTIKYSQNEMFWIGYIYRYWSYTYGKSSRQLYRIVKPKELRDLFLPYHTLSPAQAIERILESKGLPINEADMLARQYAIYRRIRMA